MDHEVGILPRRKHVRLRTHDYSALGSYFVTICAFQGQCLFGSVSDGVVKLSPIGEIVYQIWSDLDARFPSVVTHAGIVMPNHFHGLLSIDDPGSLTLGALVRQFKSSVTKRVRDEVSDPETMVWQRNYYEHIIRSESDYLRVREYIIRNPENWPGDEYNAL